MNKKDLEKLKRICDSIRANDAKNFPKYVATPGTSPDIILSYLNRAKEALSYGSKKMAQKNADEAEQYIAKFEDLQDEFRTFMARYNEALAAAKHDLRFLRADIKSMKDSAKAKDAEAVIYQVTTSQDKMGRLHTEYFGSSEEVLRKHKGRIDPSSGHPRLDGFVGPFSNGTKNGKRVFLYEDKNTYLSMDSKAKAELG